MKYEPVIGIEVHAQLKTETKLFCGCSTQFDAEPNHNCCPVCLGLPGTLPVLNHKAVAYVIRTALALNCEIPQQCRFARKNYYYPDLPKAYQISQYELPIGENGFLMVKVGENEKKVRINRVHLEEDAGKLIHNPSGTSSVDYNRTGTPLMEIVTEADISSGEEAAAYVSTLRTLLQYIGVCEASMEKGQMRCEPNISVRPAGQKEFGTKTELKNLNSFRAVERGVIYEIQRQVDVIEDGGRIIQETRRWDDTTQSTHTMRVKEGASDYRYFPDPDLVPVEITSDWRAEIKKEIPELPPERRRRFISQYGLSGYDAEVLTASRELADYFESAAAAHGDSKKAANWIMNELLGLLNEGNLHIADCPVSPGNLAVLLGLIADDTISGPIAKDVFRVMFDTGRDATAIIKEKNLVQVSGEDELTPIIEQVISENPGPAQDYRDGKKKAIGFLVGQVMKLTKGKANPKIVNKMLAAKLEE